MNINGIEKYFIVVCGGGALVDAVFAERVRFRDLRDRRNDGVLLPLLGDAVSG